MKHLATITAIVGAAAAALLAAGCSSHPTLGYIDSIERNQPLELKSLYKDDIEEKSRNVELCLMERGRIAQLQGDFEASRESFDEEVDYLRTRELDDNTLPAAQINVGSGLVNDNLLPYRARLFEVEMLRLFQCFNYLAMGSLEGAVVEIRNAEFLLNEAEKARENVDFKEEGYRGTEAGVNKKLFENEEAIKKGEADKPPPAAPEPTTESADVAAAVPPTEPAAAAEPAADKSLEAPSPHVEADTKKAEPAKPAVDKSAAEKKQEAERAKYEQQGQREYDKYFKEMAEVLAKTKSSVLNPYVIYVGGVVHEMNGELDHAYISYKKGLEVMPSNPYLRRDVVRLARKLDQTHDFDMLKASCPEAWEQIDKNPPSPDDARLVVLYEDSWAPRKEEVFITLAAVAIAYPVYRFKWCEATPMMVSSSSGEIGPTAPICYMNALALRALQEEARWRIIRQAARVAVKGATFATGATMAAASDNAGVQAAGVGIMIASAIYNNASENADLRCWMTLPENAQILVASLPPGEQSITFAPQGTQLVVKETVPLCEGKTTVVRLVRVGPRLIYQRLWPAEHRQKKSDEDAPTE